MNRRLRMMVAATGGGAFLPNQLLGLDLWLRADNISGNDGDAVASWVSKEGNAYDFVQSDADKKPLLKKAANGINGHNVVRFDGGDLLVLANAPLVSTTGTIFAVFRLASSPTDYQHILSSSDEASTNYTMRIMPIYTGTPQNYVTVSQKNNDTADEQYGNTTPITPGATYAAMWKSDGDAYSFRVKGAIQEIASVSGGNTGDWFGDTPNRDNTVIGALKRTTEAAFYKGDLAELIVYNRSLSASDIDKIENYLIDRYDLLNIQSYGAVGDGVTNDSAAFQAAIDTLAGTNRTIYAPAATYRIGTALNWKSGVNLRGDGIDQAILSLADGAQIQATGSLGAPISDCTFENFTVDGSDHTDWYKGFFITYCLRLHWSNVKVQNTGATGFGNDYMVDCTYTNCVADGCGTSCTVATAGCSGFGIGTGKYQIENTRLVNCTATNNKRYGAFFEAQGSGEGWYTSQGMSIEGGTFDSNQWGIGDCGVDGLIISDAQVNSNVAEGIYVGGPSLGYAGINGVISGCEIAFNGGLGIRPETGGEGYTLSNNNLHDNGA